MAENVVVGDEGADLSRRKFLTTATIATGAIGVVCAAVPFIASWQPSERAKALGAPAELDVSKIEPGQMAITVWRRQPIYVVRRTPEMVAHLQGHDNLLKDPGSANSVQPAYAKNLYRAREAELFVVIGVCTHLGCLPKQRFEAASAEMGSYWPGGFFCPCHGSRFDLSGRVFDGSPASVNLVVPRYEFPNARTLMIGIDEKGAA
ncbi:MAG TPA: ubiquinol-cytochrome c reductase iron-sulfur subunit [Steroidobacteraceae bacterium]